MQPAKCICCQTSDWNPKWPGLVICRNCGLMTVDTAYPEEQLRSLYSRNYFEGGEYANYLADTPAIRKILRGHLKLVQRHVAPGSHLLEIGCAFGLFLDLIRDQYPDSSGFDISQDAVAHAQSLGLQATCDSLSAAMGDKSFHAICLWDTIEHLPAPDQTLAEAMQHLAPSGHLFLTTGDFGSRMARLRGRNWRQIHPPTHLFYFTRPSLKFLCDRLSLDVVEFGTVSVYRRLLSALDSMQALKPHSPITKISRLVASVIPNRLLEMNFPLNLGDTLYLVARKQPF